AVVLVVSAKTTFAATIQVTPTSGGGGEAACANDVAEPKTLCSLTEALAVASHNDESDIINLGAGTYSIMSNDPPGYPFNGGSIDGNSLSIVGAGMGVTILDGASTRSVLALSVSGDADIVVRDLTIQNGTVPSDADSFSAGLFAGHDAGTITIERVELKDNLDGKRAGGAHLTGNSGTIIVKDCVVSGNTGAANAKANGIDIWSNFNGAIVFQGNHVQGNVGGAGWAGGVNLLNVSGGSAITVLDNLVTANAGLQVGGVNLNIFFASGPVLIANNVIADNQSTTADFLYPAGALALLSDANSPVDVDIINNTFVGNSSVEAVGGVFVYHGVPGGSSAAHTDLVNNIFFDNVAPPGTGNDFVVRANAGTTPTFTVSHNLASDGCFTNDSVTLNCDLASAALVTLTNAVQGDPLFANAASGDFSLRVGSPALDAGDDAAPSLPATDFAGARRIVGSAVDLGALEAQGRIAIDPASRAFGDIEANGTASGEVMVTNEGAGLLTVTSVSLASGAPFTIDVHYGDAPCGATSFVLTGNASCTIGIVFIPPAFTQYADTLTITSDDPTNPTLTLALTGTGTPEQAGKPPVTGDGGCTSSRSASGIVIALVLALTLTNRPGTFSVRFSRRKLRQQRP
ncbi:MAG: choice-of-anchor Q domain-containing protein, partial [Myxococcota bacterium]